jgi:hypothetical protein
MKEVVSLTLRPLYPYTHRIRGWMGPRVDLDITAERKLPAPARDRIPVFLSLDSHYLGQTQYYLKVTARTYDTYFLYTG